MLMYTSTTGVIYGNSLKGVAKPYLEVLPPNQCQLSHHNGRELTTRTGHFSHYFYCRSNHNCLQQAAGL